MQERIQQIEETLDLHAEHLTEIQRTIDQVRWILAGALGFFVLTELGLLTALKLAFWYLIMKSCLFQIAGYF